ncbi:hypothetical protein JXQ31_07220 [candidate division KSB1 bacterium]|nr:hypothetical protein [candidate division KSB1 bacterium]
MVEEKIGNILKESKLVPANINEFAEWKRSLGQKIIYKNGIYWEELRAGFFQPIHLLMRLNKSQIKTPAPLYWGIRSGLNEEEKNDANGSILYHTFPDFKTFGFHSFSKNRRKNIRKCFNTAEIIEVRDGQLLKDQGYDVVYSSLSRTRHRKIPQRDAYLKGCTAYINNGDNSRMVLAGLVNGKLGGYLEICSVEGIVYVQTLFMATDAMKYCISAGLFYTIYMICQKSESVTEMAIGQPVTDDDNLNVFKKSMGQIVKSIPAWYKIIFPIKPILKLKYPDKYYRLTGQQ